MNLENNYRLRLRESDDGEKETEAKAQIRKYMPMASMKKKGWISYDRSAEYQEKAFKDFWVKDSVEFSVYEDEAERLYARRSKTDGNTTDFNTRTWLRKAQMEASQYSPGAYDKKKLEAMVDEIPALTRSEYGIARLIEGLTDAGVIFMILSHLEKTYLDGAVFMSGDNPVVVYTAVTDIGIASGGPLPAKSPMYCCIWTAQTADLSTSGRRHRRKRQRNRSR